MKNFLVVAVIGILSAVAALVGLGYSYHSFITPISSYGEFYKIHVWMVGFLMVLRLA